MISKNNPFNIRFDRFSHWKFCLGSTKGFCDFSDIRYGLRAGFILLRNYVYKKDLFTVEEVISRYAPSTENDTRGYISYVRNVLLTNGCTPDNLRSSGALLEYDNNFFYLCKAVLKMESGYVLDKVMYIDIIQSFNIKKVLYGSFSNKFTQLTICY